MEIRTSCPTGCKYINENKCIAIECPYKQDLQVANKLTETESSTTETQKYKIIYKNHIDKSNCI